LVSESREKTVTCTKPDAIDKESKAKIADASRDFEVEIASDESDEEDARETEREAFNLDVADGNAEKDDAKEDDERLMENLVHSERG
jgi:hypothetical protein